GRVNLRKTTGHDGCRARRCAAPRKDGGRIGAVIAKAEAYGFCPFPPAASVFQPGSSLLPNCRPPEWKMLPPLSGASGCINNRLVSGSPGFTSFDAISDFLRDCSSFQALAPGDSRSRRKPLLLSAWQT